MIVILHPDPWLAASPAGAIAAGQVRLTASGYRGRPIDIEQLGLERRLGH